MIQGVKVENFRGIERLQVQGLRRVNLITGKNDCGKTALIEAVCLCWMESLNAQGLRGFDAPVADFDAYWRPIFRNGDAERGLKVELLTDGRPIRLEGRKLPDSGQGTERRTPGPGLKGKLGWTLFQRVEREGQVKETRVICRPDGRTELTPELEASAQSWWIRSRPELSHSDLKMFSDLKQAGREAIVVDLLKQISDRIQSVDLLAPTGKEAALFVRIEGGSPMLPFQMMGEGTQRCFEIALAMAVEGMPLVFLDEAENGLHPVSSEKMWRFLATASRTRGVQVFATTHSEDCIATAGRVFTELGDDGLCVLRLERREHETTVVLQDRRLGK